MFSNSDSRFNKLKVDNQVFIKFINQLYYPYPYRFDAIPVKIIAKVYEGFLAYSLVVKDGKVSVELKAEYVKTNGIIPTDEKIAEAICDETIEENSIKDISDIWSIQVLDPCCGSGIFLIAAYEKLLNRLKELAIESDNDFCICNGDERFLTIAIKQKLMSSCLYGIDIDPIAVEVTKMSLALKVIDDADPTVYTEIGLFGDKILKDIDKNIVCGNTLVDTDIDIPVNEISIIKPTDIKSLFFANVFQNKGGFSYIIGNPPYVETKYFKATSLSMHKYLKTYYHSFQGKVDLSVIFVERCIDLLALNGKIGFIIQRRWFKTTYGKNARSFIAQKGYLNKLFDIGTTDLFPGRITYVSIMVLQKSICNDVEYAYIQGNRYDVLNYFAKESVRQIIPGNYFKEEIWAPEFYGISTIKNKYCKLGMLKNNRNIHVHGGIQVLWTKIYHLLKCVENGDYIIGINGFGKQVCVEKGIVKPIICNKKFLPLKEYSKDTYCIFPYKGKSYSERIAIDDIAKDFPRAYAYLIENEEKIKNNVKYNTGEYWHTYTRVQNHEWLEHPKIILPMTSKDTVASYEPGNGYYLDNANMWFITIDGGDEIEYKAMTMIINSTIFSVFAKSGANPQAGGYYKFNKQFLEPVPFPNHVFEPNNTLIQKLAEYYDVIIKLMREYEKAIEKNKSYFVGVISRKWNEVDKLCNELYGVTEHDWNEIKKVGRELSRITGEEV